MKKSTPLTYKKAMNEILKLRPKLLSALSFRDALAGETVEEYQLAAHKFHVQVIRYGSEIADVVRRYKLECHICKREYGSNYEPKILKDWYLVDRESLLKCSVCNHITPRILHEDLHEIEELIALAPVPVQKLFASDR